MKNRKIEKLHYIDAIRGIAILMVLITHTAQQGVVKVPNELSVIFSLGARGVQLFFIASAFTLFRSYKSRGVERRPRENFFIRRFFRIAPVFYLGILYYIIRIKFDLPFWLGQQSYISNWNIWSNFFFLHGLSPYWINSFVPGGWSITVEMMFYMLFPFLFKKIKNYNDALIFLNVSLIVKLFFQEFLQYFVSIPDALIWREFLYYYLPCQLPIFALGLVMYFVIENRSVLADLNSKMILLFLVLLPLQIGSHFDFLYLNHIIFGVLFVFFGFLLSKGKLKFFSNVVTRYVGKISFSIYIIHFIVISWLARFNLVDFCDYYLLNFLIRFLVITSLSVVLSSLSYNWIEIPFQNFAKKLISKREKEL